ncbi:hypothetical protein WJX84_003717 [Apatococcus fuscideae]|uniref:Vesicle transport protein n=1 Tax=Apatococcus fuscideae TaxID=2026836 RepID=A0AAW1TEK7_9CHLO
MKAFRGWLTPADEPSSVLDEWNKYNAERAGPSSSDTIMESMEQGSSNVQSFFSRGISQVGSGVQGLGGSLQSNVQSLQMPNMQQFAYFFAFLIAGLVFLVIAFSLFLPVIILAPNKFAISFTIASGFIMAALTALKGWRQQLQHMMTQERLPFTAVYMGSMGGTLYAAMYMHSYIMSLLFCGIQVLALVYYVASYFPGGSAGVKFIMSLIYRAIANCMYGVQKAIGG